ncbi:MAG: DUF6364 family protein [Desulfosalsimonadaceae bacterium]
MKRNITLSIDNELLVRAKIVAARRQTSVSKMLADDLKALVDQSERYHAARKKALYDLEKGFHLGGQELPGREALHDRKNLR